MSQPVVEIRVADPEYVFKWMRKMFYELRLLKKKQDCPGACPGN